MRPFPSAAPCRLPSPSSAAPAPARSRQRGLSLVELMVGLVAGLVLLLGALALSVPQLQAHRRLVREAQLHQELRAVASLIQRDLRQAGYWSTPEAGVWSPDNPMPRTNPYDDLQADSGARQLRYHQARHSTGRPGEATQQEPPEDHQVTDNERFGFRLRDERLEMRLGGIHQPLTDPAVMRITDFKVQPSHQFVPLPDACDRPCPSRLADCPPVLELRDLHLSLAAQSTADPQVQHRLALRVRLRNDRLAGRCP